MEASSIKCTEGTHTTPLWRSSPEPTRNEKNEERINRGASVPNVNTFDFYNILTSVFVSLAANSLVPKLHLP